jgi:transcriptional antiterminator NusG
MEEKEKQKVNEMKWYIVTTYSAHEDKVAENILNHVESTRGLDKDHDLTKLVGRVIVANEDIPALGKDGKPKKKLNKETGLEEDVPPKKKNLYPGYIFVEMIMTNEAWFAVRNTEGVTGIVGSSGKGQKPTPVEASQMETVLKRIGIVDDAMFDQYHVGDEIKIIHGLFKDVEGKIMSIDKKNKNVQVEVVFFGKRTPVELKFDEIVKASKATK